MATRAPPAVRDSGLQSERTALAWNRTAAGLLVNGLLALRAGLVGDSAAVVILALTIVAVAAATFVFARARREALLQGGPSSAVPSWALLGVTAMVMAAALTGLGVVWV